jgi:KDO2-lipid IV(A) lauroyltransferase
MTAFLVDHNCSREEAVFLPFLGKTAAVNMGPALLALRSKALVLPVFLLREEGMQYRFQVGEALDTATLTGTREEKIRAIARFYTRAVEHMVHERPEQWFWMHKRWKTRPR